MIRSERIPSAEPTLLKPLRRPPVEVGALARRPLDHLTNLPATGGVYLALDDANRVWYVGIADSLRTRLQVHDRLSDFEASGAKSIGWKPEENRAVRQVIEKELIEFFHPPLNKQHNFNSLPEVDLGLTPDEEVERFLRLRIRLKLIEMELELLKPNIVTRCEQEYSQKIVHRLGTIRRQSYKRWQFSAEVE
ncbi:MAG: hypothetical protein JNK87_33495 [Bryobacterales bacterium]|nr:hypothetical protein [Bryobacterales bacterium]